MDYNQFPARKRSCSNLGRGNYLPTERPGVWSAEIAEITQ